MTTPTELTALSSADAPYRPGQLLRIAQRFQAATGVAAQLVQRGDQILLTSPIDGGLAWYFTADELPELVAQSTKWRPGMALEAMV
jgi:hypothetical protein